jgi:hypothetical protein
MTWIDLGYGLALTIAFGTVLAALLHWRDGRARRAAEARLRRVEPRRRRPISEDLGRHIDRAA